MVRTLLAILPLCLPLPLWAADPAPTSTSREQAGPDYAIQGEYVGPIDHQPAGVQVIALGQGTFRAVVYRGGLPGAGWSGTPAPKSLDGRTEDSHTLFKSREWTLSIREGLLTVKGAEGEALGELKRVERQSPTLNAKPPEGAVVLFDGSNIDAFARGAVLTDDHLLTPKGNILTNQSFGSFTLHLEFMTPFMPAARGQGRGNSGVYLHNRYECQVLDSFGLSGEDNECGGFYKVRRPTVNMCLPPLVWQTYDIDFVAPRFDDSGAKIASARATVRHNGVVIHEGLEFADITAGGTKPEASTGPLHLQDHGNPVRFRNIWIVERP